MSKAIAVDQKVFDKVIELVGSVETADDLWVIFDSIMYEYDPSYNTHSSNFIGYLFMVFI